MRMRIYNGMGVRMKMYSHYSGMRMRMMELGYIVEWE